MDSHKMSMPSVPNIRYDLFPTISAYIMSEIPGHRASFICTQCIHRCITRSIFVRSISAMRDIRIDVRQSYVTLSAFRLYIPVISINAIRYLYEYCKYLLRLLNLEVSCFIFDYSE